jgi:hypothetical protein
MPTVGFCTMDWSTILDPVTNQPTPGGSGWYRAHLPYRALKDAGLTTHFGRLIFSPTHGRFGVREWSMGADGEWTSDTTSNPDHDHWNCDVIVMQRWMIDGLAEDIVTARRSGQVVVQDVDDWFFGMASQNVASKSLTLDPRSNLTHYRKILISSDLVIASTPYLGRRLAQFCPNVRVVRNHIDIDRWAVREQREVPVLGWAGAVPWRSGDVETLRGSMGDVLARMAAGRLKFHHHGDMGREDYPPAGSALRLPDEHCTTSPLCPVTEWPNGFRHFDVGIVPLSDRPFNEAKSAIKGMEYAASGKPFIAQETSEYRWLKVWGCGRVAKRATDWQRHLRTVLDMDVADREKEGRWNRDALIDGGLTTRHLAERWLETVLAGIGTRRLLVR